MDDADDFAPGLLRIQQRPPAPLAGWTLKLLIALLGAALVWAAVGQLDIVAVSDGKLVPSSYLKIVQPAEQGIVKQLLVREGETVKQGQVLIRMDPAFTEADVATVNRDVQHGGLALRRIDAELLGMPLRRVRDDPPELYAHMESQRVANVNAYENALLQERSMLEKATNDLAAARETKAKLDQVLPHYRDQERAFEKLANDGFAGRIMATDKQRERIEREQDLRAQEYIIRSNAALIVQSEKKLAQITAEYRRQLQTERVETATQLEKARQQLARHERRRELLELRAPADGTVKDLATHTIGTVAAPGTVLMTLVPTAEKLMAEVWVGNQDVGFVHAGQPVKLKLAPFQFQKYGMIAGTVERVSADATEQSTENASPGGVTARAAPAAALAFRTLVSLNTEALESGGLRYELAPGMQVSAEIHLGTRSVLEYLLSPVRKAFHDAARER